MLRGRFFQLKMSVEQASIIVRPSAGTFYIVWHLGIWAFLIFWQADTDWRPKINHGSTCLLDKSADERPTVYGLWKTFTIYRSIIGYQSVDAMVQTLHQRIEAIIRWLQVSIQQVGNWLCYRPTVQNHTEAQRELTIRRNCHLDYRPKFKMSIRIWPNSKLLLDTLLNVLNLVI